MASDELSEEPTIYGKCKCSIEGRKGPAVVVSVPHGCRGEEGCDDGAPKAARIIEETAGNVCVVLNTIRRSKMDMNRPPTWYERVGDEMVPADVSRGQSGVREHPFRKAIDSLASDPETILIDGHSYPEGYGDFPDFDVVLFNQHGRHDDAFVRKFASAIEKEGASVGIVRGRAVNDIVVTRGGRSVLVEFRENERIEKNARAVGLAVRKLSETPD